MLWCSIQPIRQTKSAMVMKSLFKGWPFARICNGDPPDDGNLFAIYGQTWGAERLIPPALKTGRPFWQIDNGFWKPGRGSTDGYYRFCYRSLSPVLLADADHKRAAQIGAPAMAPWRKSGTHILLALPGGDFGTALGLSMVNWEKTIRARVRQYTDRPIVVRDRRTTVALDGHLTDCWALVTHSSNVAVEAVRAGIPVFVEPTSAAAPVGNLDLARLEKPAMPSTRKTWWSSLLSQQFTPAEMASGLAYEYLGSVAAQVDGQVAA